MNRSVVRPSGSGTPMRSRSTSLSAGLVGRLFVAVAALLLLAPLAAGPASADTGVTVTSTTQIFGRGFGHGRGMSQYGARGQAQAGRTYTQILGSYYPGTRFSSLQTTLRVWISRVAGSSTVVRGGSGLSVTDFGRHRTFTLPATPSVWKLTIVSGRTRVYAHYSGAWHLYRTGGKFALTGTGQFRSRTGQLKLLVAGAYQPYRGAMRLVAGKTINVVDLEKYLRGVVPSEMPALWPAQALQAQAVAARTYAAYKRAAHLNESYQICDTSACQVYKGVTAEYAQSSAAVTATAGRILVYNGAPAFTEFSASNGGYSVAGDAPYLVSKPDPYDAYPEWNVPLNTAALQAGYPSIGTLTTVQVVSRMGGHAYGAGGWVTSVKLTGSAGNVVLSTPDDILRLRRLLGLKSTYFRFSS